MLEERNIAISRAPTFEIFFIMCQLLYFVNLGTAQERQPVKSAHIDKMMGCRLRGLIGFGHKLFEA